MIIETVDSNGKPMTLVGECICAVCYSPLSGLWVVYDAGGSWYGVTEQVAQGILKALKSMNDIREVKP